jgi:hypothetical protein
MSEPVAPGSPRNPRWERQRLIRNSPAYRYGLLVFILVWLALNLLFQASFRARHSTADTSSLYVALPLVFLLIHMNAAFPPRHRSLYIALCIACYCAVAVTLYYGLWPVAQQWHYYWLHGVFPPIPH